MTEFAITFTGKPKADKNKWLYYGQVEMSSDVGFIVPSDGLSILNVTTNQDGTDDSDIDLLVDNSVEATLAVTNRDHVFAIDVPVSEGSRVHGFNQNDNDLEDFSMTVFFSLTVAPPSLGIKVGDFVNVSLINGGFYEGYEVIIYDDETKEVMTLQAPDGTVVLIGQSAGSVEKIS